MESNKSMVLWTCQGPSLFAMSRAMVEAKPPDEEDKPTNEGDVPYQGRIGRVNVAIRESTFNKLPTVVDSNPGAVILIVRLCQGDAGTDMRPGDWVIGRINQDPDLTSTRMPDRIQTAAQVLQNEVGSDGAWLSSGLSRAESSVSGQLYQHANGRPPGSPRLHYKDIDPNSYPTWLKGSWDKLEVGILLSEAVSTALTNSANFAVAILGSSSEKIEVSKVHVAAAVALYAKEIIQVMANGLIRTIDSIRNTEKIVPPLSHNPKPPQFQRYRHVKYGNAVMLVIPTENESKKNTLEKIFREKIFRDKERKDVALHTFIVGVDSGVGEQPYNQAGLTGAYNRISNALARLGTTAYKKDLQEKQIGTVILASIENFIQTEGVKCPTDYGVMVAHNATTQKTTISWSHGVTVPAEYVKRARRFGFEKDDPDYGRVTVSQIMAANIPWIDKADWHKVLVGKSRYDILEEAGRRLETPW